MLVAGGGPWCRVLMGVEGLSGLLPWLELVGVGLQVLATAAAAVATVASVGVIAWQSVMTRQSVQLTREALEIAREEALVARDGLEVARADSVRADLLALEGRQSRVDADEPRLVVSPLRTAWGRYRLGICTSDMGKTSAVDGGEIVRIPVTEIESSTAEVSTF